MRQRCLAALQIVDPMPLPSWMRRARWAMLPMVLALAVGLRLCGVEGWTAAIVGLSFGGLGLFVMGLVSRKMGVMVHCTLCGACLSTCPHDQLSLGFFWGRSKLARPVFLALISAMYSIFLGLARI